MTVLRLGNPDNLTLRFKKRPTPDLRRESINGVPTKTVSSNEVDLVVFLSDNHSVYSVTKYWISTFTIG